MAKLLRSLDDAPPHWRVQSPAMKHFLRSSLCLLIASLAIGTDARAAALQEITQFGSNPGALKMLVQVPEGLPPHAPLVVLAHGCFQNAQDIADMSGWSELASAHRFALLLPQTSTANESMGGCFRTWLPAHQHRDGGEPLSVAQMVQWMLEHHSIDPRKVFMTGLSSGGLLTNVMLATYPDVFAAGAPQAAYPYQCATSFADVAACCLGQKRRTSSEWGDLVRSGFPGYRGTRPRVFIWHGSADPLLHVINLTDQLKQWTNVAGIDDVPDEVKLTGGYARYVYADSAGRPKVETVTIPGMTHGVAIDPTGKRFKCGAVRPYALDVGVCAAEVIAQSFGILP